ncbi:hypothetical protein [Candidatus Fokinia solitaria]|nr:hypothetical protein [Candidatus Fokinia solitaria]
MLFITILISNSDNSGELGVSAYGGKEQEMSGVTKIMMVLGCTFMLNTLLIAKLSMVSAPSNAYERDFDEM